MWAALGVALGLVLASGGVTAQQQTATTTSTEAMTVYVSGHGGKELAADLNKVHQTHAPAGWAPVAVTAHQENNDQKGLWVTYVRTVTR